MNKTMKSTNPAKNSKMIKGLRDIIDLIDALPENAPNAYIYDTEVHFFVTTVEEMVNLRLSIGGKFDKMPNDSFYYLMKTMPNYKVVIFANRENVCEKVKVGTKKVMDYDKNVPMIEVEEDIYEWICPDKLKEIAE